MRLQLTEYKPDTKEIHKNISNTTFLTNFPVLETIIFSHTKKVIYVNITWVTYKLVDNWEILKYLSPNF